MFARQSLVHLYGCPRWVILLGFGAAVIVSGPPSSGAPAATVTVDPARRIGAVNKWIFGNNMLAYQKDERGPDWQDQYSHRGSGIWDPDAGAPVAEYLELAKAAGISVARWPGGCEVHRYNWKRVVGPVQERPWQKFGLGEFLKWCRAAGAEPLITLADYWGDERDAADLVEYLNAPVGTNPNGGKDWAAVRAAEGHPAPWKVTWFECGNESDHGTHDGKQRLTPEEYGERYKRFRAAMRRVDPSVKLGVVCSYEDWNRRVLKTIGPGFDFLIVHTYIPGAWLDQIKNFTPRQVAEACLAADLQIRDSYLAVAQQALEVTGRRNVPIAVTEYNGGFVQEEPVPYRQCLANALRNADHLRVMLDPSLNIVMANFWQYANEYWGMVRGWVHEGQTPVRQANYFVYQLYHDHFGDELVGCDVQCARWDFAGACGVASRKGTGQEYRLFAENLFDGQAWQTWPCEHVKQELQDEGRVLVAEFDGAVVNYFHGSVHLPAEPSTGYEVAGWVKTENLECMQGVGFQVGDDRGWTETHSAVCFGDLKGTNDWTRVEGSYVTLPDTKGITINTRHVDIGDEIRGKAWFRLEAVRKFQPKAYPAVPYLEAIASRRQRDGAFCIILIHKDLDADTAVTLTIRQGRAKTARAWALTGPSPDATNLSGEVCSVRELPCRVAAGHVRLTLPRCSLVAIEVSPAR